MRKLASIQTVQALEPIPNADAIERAKILGWWVVVQKGSLKVGEKVVYCEIDSLLPELPEFEFLRKTCYRVAIVGGDQQVLQRSGFRIRTVKLRGQISQGICFSIDSLRTRLPSDLPEGLDVTDGLGIIKWDPPLPASLSGRVKGNFPDFIPKTDETRVQILENVLKRHQHKTLYVTEKVDGSSCTIFCLPDRQGVCGPSALKFARKSIGMTRDELAAILGVETDTVCRWEQGTEPFMPAIQMAIAYLISCVESGQALPTTAP